jgi:hypothetical protein
MHFILILSLALAAAFATGYLSSIITGRSHINIDGLTVFNDKQKGSNDENL